MDEILTAIYYGQLNISDTPPPYLHNDKLDALYKRLVGSLSKEQAEIFQEFLLCNADKYSSYQEYAFKQGMKLSFQLTKELNNIKL